MKNTVIIKGNRYGISIVLNDKVEFSKLLEDLSAKLEGAEEFFDSDKQLAITFEGRELSNEELDQLLTVIQSNSKLNIQYVMDENSDVEATFFDILQLAEESDEKDDLLNTSVENVPEAISEQGKELNTVSDSVTKHEQKKDNAGMFYKGTLRSGQTLEARDSLIIIGDVNPGAHVIAGGNVIIIGTLKGSVTAGTDGNKKAFVMALSMNPLQIQIADVISRSSDPKKILKRKQDAMIATILDGRICMESVSKIDMQDISF